MVKINLHGAVPLTEPCRPGKNYFLHDASLSNNPVFYKKVLTQAKKNICILDPYACESDAARVFECIHVENIKIDIITTGYSEEDIKLFTDDIINIIKKNISTYSLSIITYRERGVRLEQQIPLWHDRYLIIDDTDYYLIGSSLDSQQTSRKYHGMLLLTEEEDKKIIEDLFVKYQTLYNSLRAYKTSRR